MTFEEALNEIKNLRNDCTQMAAVGRLDHAMRDIVEALIVCWDYTCQSKFDEDHIWAKTLADEIKYMESDLNRFIDMEDKINLSGGNYNLNKFSH